MQSSDKGTNQDVSCCSVPDKIEDPATTEVFSQGSQAHLRTGGKHYGDGVEPKMSQRETTERLESE